jgi:hypothetical protein
MQIMPRIFTEAYLEPTKVDGKQPSKPDSKEEKYFKEGDYVMVILKECYIGDNKEWWVNGGEV